jgi:hypothetical protein
MTEFACDHTFKTTLNVSKFEAMVAKACRAPYGIECIAHDPGIVPAVRLFTVGFTTPEDRDRMRIAMRFIEKEQAAMGQKMTRTKAPASAAAPALATA